MQFFTSLRQFLLDWGIGLVIFGTDWYCTSIFCVFVFISKGYINTCNNITMVSIHVFTFDICIQCSDDENPCYVPLFTTRSS
jgi:hypothetical protein